MKYKKSKTKKNIRGIHLATTRKTVCQLKDSRCVVARARSLSLLASLFIWLLVHTKGTDLEYSE
jgi:hypothetical protein